MADEGASPRELIIEACRRNNTDLLSEVITTTKPTSPTSTHETAVASLLNNTTDPLGNAALHIAASNGSYETLDLLLDQPGLETDPRDRLNGETPLHKAVALCNTFRTTSSSAQTQPTYPSSTSSSSDVQTFLEANEGHPIVEILLDAGCDPRIRNKGKMKPVEQVNPNNTALRDFLRRAELALVEGESGIVEAEEGGAVDSDGPSDED